MLRLLCAEGELCDEPECWLLVPECLLQKQGLSGCPDRAETFVCFCVFAAAQSVQLISPAGVKRPVPAAAQVSHMQSPSQTSAVY